MKRLLALACLGAPAGVLGLLLVKGGPLASTFDGPVPVPLATWALVSLGSWAAGMAWLAGQRRETGEVRTLIQAAEALAGGDLETNLPDAETEVGQRLTIALESLTARLSASQEAATVDRLTGVASRTALLGALVTEVERAGRYERPLSVAFVDIDHFKAVNDNYGHAAGDIVLSGVAQALQSNLRATDQIGRYGGEEFMLILPETTVEEAGILGEKLRGIVERQRFPVEGNRQLAVTVSIGIAGGVGRTLRFESLARNADAAMYTAKALGRNQTYLFSEPDEDARVLRSPITPAGRAHATSIGLAARDAATAVLGAAISAMPAHKGRPTTTAAVIVTAIAEQLALPDDEIDRIRLAALLRDIGKMVVPNDVLDKPAALTAREWQSIVQHPQLGQVILERAASLRDAVPIILHHHEHYSGQGYPYGLRGNDIPLGARIVAIADAYEAMTQPRPYRPALSHVEALREIRRNAGSQFDPELVSVFCSLYTDMPPRPDGSIEAQLAPLNLLARPAGRSAGVDDRPAAAADGIAIVGDPARQVDPARIARDGDSHDLPAANQRTLRRRAG